MALRISKRSWRRADSRARCCAHFTLETATPARMPMIVTTTINSINVKPRWRRLGVGIGAPEVKPETRNQKPETENRESVARTRVRDGHLLVSGFWFLVSIMVTIR